MSLLLIFQTTTNIMWITLADNKWIFAIILTCANCSAGGFFSIMPIICFKVFGNKTGA